MIQLNNEEILLLIVSAQAQVANKNVCTCEESVTCYPHQIITLLKRFSRKTGYPVQYPDLQESKAKQKEVVTPSHVDNQEMLGPDSYKNGNYV